MVTRTISFFVPLVPEGKKQQALGKLHMYKPKATRINEAVIIMHAGEHAPAAPLEGPIRLTGRFLFTVPKSWSKKKREAALNGKVRPVGKPDLSNCEKQLEDALTKAGIWCDDSQVVERGAGGGKFYSERAGIFVKVEALNEPSPRARLGDASGSATAGREAAP